MTIHTANGLFDLNIKSAKDSLALYDAIAKLDPKGVDIDWVLRSAVVFTVSALDTYFHDKVKYKVGKYDLTNLPPALAKFQISVQDLISWDQATRKGNVLRNWVVEDLSTRPLQSPYIIAETLKLANINSLWDTIEPDKKQKEKLLVDLNALVQRRNQISHEGDRMTSRRSGKGLRRIERTQVETWIQLVGEIVRRIETAWPN